MNRNRTTCRCLSFIRTWRAGNLAADREKNRELILAMNAKMNTIMEEEVGVDDGSSLGLKKDTDYAFTPLVAR